MRPVLFATNATGRMHGIVIKATST